VLRVECLRNGHIREREYFQLATINDYFSALNENFAKIFSEIRDKMLQNHNLMHFFTSRGSVKVM